MADETLLVIQGIGVAPYSARGLTQTIEPIEAAAVLARTINGTLVNIAATQMQKYKTTISCKDLEAPAFDGVWPGAVLTIDCVAELGFKTGSGSAGRPVVSGSSRLVGDYTYYRPQLLVMVTKFTHGARDEYGHMTDWSIEAEEV